MMNTNDLKQILIFMERYQLDLTCINGKTIHFKEYEDGGYNKYVYTLSEIIKMNKPIK